MQTKRAQVQRFNDAISRAKGGTNAQAVAELRALLAEVTDEALRKVIADALDSLGKPLTPLPRSRPNR